MGEKIAVVGAGMVGCVQAISMARRGHDVCVFEKRKDPDNEDYREGKSINMALSDRGFRILDQLGIGDEIRELAIPMYGRMMHQSNGSLVEQAYGVGGQAIYSISRWALNKHLIGLARKTENVQFAFEERCVDLKLPENEMKFVSPKREGIKTEIFDRIFGADGAYSSIRSRLQKINRFNYSQSFLDHGYKELTMPARANGRSAMAANVLHIWPRGEYMLIALPNKDGSFTCTLFLPFEGEHSFEAIQSEQDLKAFFNENFSDALPLMPNLVADYFSNPPSSLVTIECSPWNYQDKVLLMGDAAHAIVPFYGQGMNCGLEDVFTFSELLDKSNNNWEEAVQHFSKSRKKDTDAIMELALGNFHEMCAKTADPQFLLRKKMEALLAKQFPATWIPLYTRVTFSSEPYSHAKLWGEIQDGIMDEVMQLNKIEERWNSTEVLNFAIQQWNEKITN